MIYIQLSLCFIPSFLKIFFFCIDGIYKRISLLDQHCIILIIWISVTILSLFCKFYLILLWL